MHPWQLPVIRDRGVARVSTKGHETDATTDAILRDIGRSITDPGSCQLATTVS